MSDRIEKSLEIAAPLEKVWKALTDYRQFGTWFRVAIDAPFAAGARSTGQMTIPGFEHAAWNADIVAMEPMTRFAYRWHPYAVEAGRDYSDERRTLVNFALEPTADGTRITVVESGFTALPSARYEDAIRANTGGWNAQLENIRKYAEG